MGEGEGEGEGHLSQKSEKSGRSTALSSSGVGASIEM